MIVKKSEKKKKKKNSEKERNLSVGDEKDVLTLQKRMSDVVSKRKKKRRVALKGGRAGI